MRTKDAYAARAVEYVELLGRIEATSPIYRQNIAQWASTVDGIIVDAGCGPGHWAHYLQELGAEVEGVDMVPEFIENARARFPNVNFQEGLLENLPYGSDSVAGILSWYSVIHTEPEMLQEILEEFARCLAPGGTLLLGFFEGSKLEVFDHVVAPAYFWPVEEMEGALKNAGFNSFDIRKRTDEGCRPHADIVAVLDIESSSNPNRT